MVLRQARLAVLLAALGAPAGACSRPPDFDVIVYGGIMIDGTGQPARQADVGINGDQITALGSLGGRRAAELIDATGKIVAPGFIDARGRSGVALLAGGFGESHLRQGITSEILGENSPVFWTARTADAAALQRHGLTLDWSGPIGYFDKLESQGTAINVGTLVPLSLARANGGAAPAFIEAAVRDGAFGVSDDVNADATELGAASAAAGRHDGAFMAPVEGALANGDDVLLSVGAHTRRILISGLSRVPTDDSMTDLIRRFVRAGQRQIAVYGTAVPYPAVAGGDETGVRNAVKFSGAMIGTDTSAFTASSAPAGTHPAAFGAFPRLLGQLARDEHLVDLTEAVRRATSVPANVFQIPRRGIIRENYFADIVIFDRRTIADRATFEKPNQYPAGIDYVIVNGVVTLTPKGLTGSRAGSRLLHRAAPR